MQIPGTAIFSRRRVMWLLWLVLLLPVAQTAATLHELSHAMSDVAGQNSPLDGKQAVTHAPCDLCLTSAALIGAAPPATPPRVPQLAALRDLPPAVFASVWFAPTVPAYESRAPPFSVL